MASFDVHACDLTCVQLFATITLQEPLSMGFSRQEYWSGLPFPTLKDLADPGIEPTSPVRQVDFFFFFYHETKASYYFFDT